MYIDNTLIIEIEYVFAFGDKRLCFVLLAADAIFPIIAYMGQGHNCLSTQLKFPQQRYFAESLELIICL